MYEQHLLPPAARLVHIGPPKTGTTAIQNALAAVRHRLPEHGVHYAGAGHRPKAAVYELLRSAGTPGEGAVGPAWDELVREVQGIRDLRVCVSNEQFAVCDDSRAARVVQDLGGEATHVVMVVRPLAALLPSQWQQRVRKRRSMMSYEDWLRVVLSDEPDGVHHEHFWRMHDLSRLIDRWTAATSPDRVVVAVSDETDRSFLPRFFEGLLGLPEGLLVPPHDRSNRSLDHAEAELLRALDDQAYDLGWGRSLYVDDLKPAISRHLRVQPRGDGSPITLPGWALDRVEELNDQRIRLLQQADVRVVGEPDALRGRQQQNAEATPTSTEAPAPSGVPVVVAARVAAAGIDRMRRREQALRKKVRRQQRVVERLRRQKAAGGRSVDEAGVRELTRALAGRILRRGRRSR